MRFIAVQSGARRGYAVPAILEEAGLLERFYTDICGSVGWGQAARYFQFVPKVGHSFRRLHNRSLPSSIRTKTTTFDRLTLRKDFDRWCLNGDATRPFDATSASAKIGA